MSMTTKSLMTLAVALISISHVSAYEPLVTHFGLGDIVHPMENVPAFPVPRDFDKLCQCRKDHVHIFGVNGLNPLCTGNFNGLCQVIRRCGFENTSFDQLYTCDDIPCRIRDIRRRNPEARIVLIGFSLGCNSVRSMANELNAEGVPIDLMIYIVGDFIRNTPYSQPNNVQRLVNIRSRGLVLSGGDLFFNGADLDRARNHKMTERHIVVPSRRETQELCVEEILLMMCQPKAR